MSVPHTLLGLLEVEPRHGYDLKRAYDARFGQARPLKPGQVYSTLGRLQRDGFVVVTGTAREAGPDRTTYAVTREGVTDLDRWFSQPEGAAPYLQSVVFAKVVLALQSGRDARAVLDTQRSEHLSAMRELTAQKQGAALDRVLGLDFALFHLEADLRWLEHTANRLDRLEKELSR